MRFSLANILWFVAWVALAFAAVRTANDFWLGATFLLTVGLLCAGVLGAVLERGKGGVWWLGFALFGWAFFVLGLIPGSAGFARLPARELARWDLQYSTPPAGPVATMRPMIGADGRQTSRQAEIGFCLSVLIFARAGATVSCLFTKGLPWKRPRPGDSTPSLAREEGS